MLRRHRVYFCRISVDWCTYAPYIALGEYPVQTVVAFASLFANLVHWGIFSYLARFSISDITFYKTSASLLGVSALGGPQEGAGPAGKRGQAQRGSSGRKTWNEIPRRRSAHATIYTYLDPLFMATCFAGGCSNNLNV